MVLHVCVCVCSLFLLAPLFYMSALIASAQTPPPWRLSHGPGHGVSNKTDGLGDSTKGDPAQRLLTQVIVGRSNGLVPEKIFHNMVLHHEAKPGYGRLRFSGSRLRFLQVTRSYGFGPPSYGFGPLGYGFWEKSVTCMVCAM